MTPVALADALQRINSPAFVFSAALPPLLAVSASESLSLLSVPLNSIEPAHPLASLPESVRALRSILDTVHSIDIPSHPSSPLIHIQVKPSVVARAAPATSTALAKNATPSDAASKMVSEASRVELERLLQEVVNECGQNGVLVTRTKRNWEQEMIEQRPSLRICVSAGLTKKEIERAGGVLKSALVKVLGKGKK